MTTSTSRKEKHFSRLGSALLAGTLSLLPSSLAAAPKAVLWEKWLAHDPNSAGRVDHSTWDSFLRKYVRTGKDGVNRVAYGRVAPADKRALESYIEHLERTPVSRLNRNEQLAYWINLYNALTVKVVLDRYPVGSILRINISPGFFSFGPWGKKLARVEGVPLSLDDIEHRILRPIWRDPRIHYAVNCASVSCPNLALKAYTAERVDSMLSAGARAYVNHPRGVRLTEDGLIVSSIYKWYRQDFGKTDAEVIGHLRRYASPALKEKLAGVEQIYDDHYDWELNEFEREGAGTN